MDTVYKVDSKEEIRRLGKGGEVETWYRIWATTAKGTYFHVDIPEAALDKAKSDAILTKRAQQLDAI